MTALPRPDTTVEVVPYDPAWPERFAAERRLLLDAVPWLFRSVEHIGSTAVPGLAAKPTIDILAVAGDLARVLASLTRLGALGYEYKPESFADPAHLFFRKVRDGKRSHHLHVLDAASPAAEEFRLFRDFLIADPPARRRYEAVKRDLAARYAADRPAYVRAKIAFVDGLMAEARRWEQSVIPPPA